MGISTFNEATRPGDTGGGNLMSDSLDKLLNLLKPEPWQSWPSTKISYVNVKAEIQYSIVKGEDEHLLEIATVSEGQKLSAKRVNLHALDEDIAELITWRDKLAKLEGKE